MIPLSNPLTSPVPRPVLRDRPRYLAFLLGALLVVGAPALCFAQSDGRSAGTLREAVQMVEDETGGRILAAETVTTGQSRLYRIKVLTPDGTVRIVQIVATEPQA